MCVVIGTQVGTTIASIDATELGVERSIGREMRCTISHHTSFLNLRICNISYAGAATTPNAPRMLFR